MKTLKLIAAILFSGLCWYFSFDLSGNYWYLLWLAPIPVLLLSFHVSAKKTFIISFIAYLAGRLSWLSYLLVVLPLPLAIFSTVLLPLIFAFIVLLTRRIVLKKQNAWSAFAFPVLWCLFEFLAFKFSPDGTAGSIAYTQSNFLQLIQIASVTGILGITFLVTLFPSAIAVAIYHRHNKKQVKPLAVIFFIVVIPLIFGIIRLSNDSFSENAITVGLVVVDEKFHEETNHPNSEKEFSTANMYGDAITKLAHEGAQVVLLPEKTLNVTPEFGFPIKSVLANASTSNHITVIAGYTEFINDSLKMNKASVIADGRILADYQKVNLFAGEKRSGFVHGNTNATFKLQNVSSGVAICKDLDFQNFMRSYDTKHVQILYVPAWDFIKDGWLHSRMAILRGVENGYAIVRAARQGELTISDYRGKVLYEATTTNNNAASLLARVPLHSTKTVYSQFGDWFGYIIVIAAIYFIIIIVVNNKHKLAQKSSER
jgi:apolipoprotein N-acyltransferase